MTTTRPGDVSQIAADLSVFADLGTEPPSVEFSSTGHVLRLIRLGEVTEIRIASKTGAITEIVAEEITKHINFKALLASDRYGSLRNWAAKQRTFLDQQIAQSGSLIPMTGILNNDITKIQVSAVDDLLSVPQRADSTHILLIDGPAGIGKTQFILGLAAERARRYNAERRPLILHVQSRGRTLSYIYDLMAYSLQRLRIEATFDQVPILAKHGLITIAIDGFDELADPDGYDLAWSEVSNLIANLRGSGSMILAGRETFIGRDRIVKDIASLREGIDEISVLTLQPPTKGEALKWLGSQGWTRKQLDAIENFLEPSSLALRPFFLKTLSDKSVADQILATTSTNILSILMDAMIEREAGKFGEPVEAELSEAERQIYISNLMGEVARDMAENSSAAVSDATLSWLVDFALPAEISDNVRRLLKARSQVLAFLTNDDTAGFRKFYHDKFYEYFLSTVLINTVRTGEISKTVARSVLGSSLLETFGAVISGSTPPSHASDFLEKGLRIIQDYPPVDRTRRNIAALVIASLGVSDLINGLALRSIDIDEARFSGTASSACFTGVVISQFDCRGADLSRVIWESCTVLTLIANAETLVSNSFPRPIRLQDISSGSGVISEPIAVDNWLNAHRPDQPKGQSGLIPANLREHEAIKLLAKACRLRQYWIRRGDDVYASRILDS